MNSGGNEGADLEQKYASYFQRNVITSISGEDNNIFTQYLPLECNNIDYFRQIIDICCQCVVASSNDVSLHSEQCSSTNSHAPITNVSVIELLNELSGFSVLGSFAFPQRQSTTDTSASADGCGVGDSGGITVSYTIVYPTLYVRTGYESSLEVQVSQLVGYLDQFRQFMLTGTLKDPANDPNPNCTPDLSSSTGACSFHHMFARTSCVSRMTEVFEAALRFTSCFEPEYDPYAGAVDPKVEPMIRHQLELLALQQQCVYHKQSKQHRLQSAGCALSEMDQHVASSLFDSDSSETGYTSPMKNTQQQQSPLRVTDIGPDVSCNYTPKKHCTLHSTTTCTTHVYQYNLEQESLLKTVTYLLQYMRLYAPTATCNSNNSSEVAYTFLIFRLAAITQDLNYYIHHHATKTFNYTEAHRLHSLNRVVDNTIHISLLNDTSTDSEVVCGPTAAGSTLSVEEAAAEEARSIAPIPALGPKDYPSLNIEPKDSLPPLVYGKQRLHTVHELVRIARNLLVNLQYAEAEANKKSNFAVAATLLNCHRELTLTMTNLEQYTAQFEIHTDVKISSRILNSTTIENSETSCTSFIGSDFLFKYIYKSTDGHSIAGLIIKASAKRTLQYIQQNWPGISVFNKKKSSSASAHGHKARKTVGVGSGMGTSVGTNSNSAVSKDNVNVVNVGLGYGKSTSGRMGVEHQHIITEPVSFESWEVPTAPSAGGNYVPPLPSHHIEKPPWGSQGGRLTHNNSMNTMNANDVCGHSFEDTLTASFRRTLSSKGVNNTLTSSTTQRTRVLNTSLYSKPTVTTELKKAELVIIPTHSSQSLRLRSMASSNISSTAGTSTVTMGRSINTIVNNSGDGGPDSNSSDNVNVQKLLYDWNNANSSVSSHSGRTIGHKPTPTCAVGGATSANLSRSINVSNSLLGVPRANYASTRPYLHGYYNTSVHNRVMHSDAFGGVLNSAATRDNAASHGLTGRGPNGTGGTGTGTGGSVVSSVSRHSGVGVTTSTSARRPKPQGWLNNSSSSVNSPSRSGTQRSGLATGSSEYGGYVDANTGVFVSTNAASAIVHVVDSASTSGRDSLYSALRAYCGSTAMAHTKLLHRLHCLVQDLLHIRDHYCNNDHPNQAPDQLSTLDSTAAETYTEDSVYSVEFHRIDELIHILLGTINSDCIAIDGSSADPEAAFVSQDGELKVVETTSSTGVISANTNTSNTNNDGNNESLLDAEGLLCGYPRLEEVSDLIHQSGAYMHQLGARIQQANTNRDYVHMKSLKDTLHDYKVSLDKLKASVKDVSILEEYEVQNLLHTDGTKVLTSDFLFQFHASGLYGDTQNLASLSIICGNARILRHIRRYWPDFSVLTPLTVSDDPPTYADGTPMPPTPNPYGNNDENEDILFNNIAQLSRLGFTIPILESAGVSNSDILAAGFSIQDLREHGFNVNHLRNSTSLSDRTLRNLALEAAGNGDGNGDVDGDAGVHMGMGMGGANDDSLSHTYTGRPDDASAGGGVAPVGLAELETLLHFYNVATNGGEGVRTKTGAQSPARTPSSKHPNTFSLSAHSPKKAKAKSSAGSGGTSGLGWTTASKWRDLVQQVDVLTHNPPLIQAEHEFSSAQSGYAQGHGQCIARPVSRLGRNEPPFGITYSTITPDANDAGTNYSEFNPNPKHEHKPNSTYSAVTRLVLPNNNIAGNLPECLSVLGSLQHVILNNNKLKDHIPAGIGNLPDLTTLYLHCNRLSGCIPHTLGHCSQLLVLRLENNQISGTIPDALCRCIHLKRIVLSNNQLTGPIPHDIGRLSTLQELILSNNHISGSIPPSLSNCALLTTCMLNNNEFSGVITESIAHLSFLTALHLQENRSNTLHVDKLTLQRWLPKCHIKL